MMNSVDLDILPVDENVIKAVGEKYGLQRDVIPVSYTHLLTVWPAAHRGP